MTGAAMDIDSRDALEPFFTGLCFVVAGMPEQQEMEVCDAIFQLGGDVFTEYESKCTHVLVDQLTMVDPICILAKQEGKYLVTVDWLRDCLDEQRVILPDKATHLPLRAPDGIPGASKLTVSLTGYRAKERQYIERLVNMMGARFSKALATRVTTHLVVYDFQGDKYLMAKKHGIQMVNHRWMEHCIQEWRLLPEGDYSMSGAELEAAEAAESTHKYLNALPATGGHLTAPCLAPPPLPAGAPLAGQGEGLLPYQPLTKPAATNGSPSACGGQTAQKVSAGSNPAGKRGQPGWPDDSAQGKTVPQPASCHETTTTQSPCAQTERGAARSPPPMLGLEDASGKGGHNAQDGFLTGDVDLDAPTQPEEDVLEGLQTGRGSSGRESGGPLPADVKRRAEAAAEEPLGDLDPLGGPTTGGHRSAQKDWGAQARGALPCPSAGHHGQSGMGSQLAGLTATDAGAGFLGEPVEKARAQQEEARSKSRDDQFGRQSPKVDQSDASRLQADGSGSSMRGSLGEMGRAAEACTPSPQSGSGRGPGASGEERPTTQNAAPAVSAGEARLTAEQPAQGGTRSREGGFPETRRPSAPQLERSLRPPEAESEFGASVPRSQGGVSQKQAGTPGVYGISGEVGVGLATPAGRKGVQTSSWSLGSSLGELPGGGNSPLSPAGARGQQIRAGVDEARGSPSSGLHHGKANNSSPPRGSLSLAMSLPSGSPGATFNMEAFEVSSAKTRVGTRSAKKRPAEELEETDQRADPRRRTSRCAGSPGRIQPASAGGASGRKDGLAFQDCPAERDACWEKAPEGVPGGGDGSLSKGSPSETRQWEASATRRAAMETGKLSQDPQAAGRRSTPSAERGAGSPVGSAVEEEVRMRKTLPPEVLRSAAEPDQVFDLAGELPGVDKGARSSRDAIPGTGLGVEDFGEAEAAGARVKAGREEAVPLEDPRQGGRAGESNQRGGGRGGRGRGGRVGRGGKASIAKQESEGRIGGRGGAGREQRQSRAAEDAEGQGEQCVDGAAEAQQGGGAASGGGCEGGKKRQDLRRDARDNLHKTPRSAVLLEEAGGRRTQASKHGLQRGSHGGSGRQATEAKTRVSEMKVLREGNGQASAGSEIVKEQQGSRLPGKRSLPNGCSNEPSSGVPRDAKGREGSKHGKGSRERGHSKKAPGGDKRHRENAGYGNGVEEVAAQQQGGDRMEAEGHVGGEEDRRPEEDCGAEAAPKDSGNLRGEAQEGASDKGLGLGLGSSLPSPAHEPPVAGASSETGWEDPEGPLEPSEAGAAGAGAPLGKGSPQREAGGQQRCFAFGGWTAEKEEWKAVVKELGGRLCGEHHQWKSSATHVVLRDLRRTEKFFAAAAAGRWILRASYLEHSLCQRRFVEEAPHEWHGGGPTEDGCIWGEAPRKWRRQREATGRRAFEGWRLLLYGDCVTPPTDTLKRALKAGGGVLLATKPPYRRAALAGVDFAIVPPGTLRDDPWVSVFLGAGIPCVTAEYFVEYIAKPGHPLASHTLFNSEALAESTRERLEARASSGPGDRPGGLPRLQPPGNAMEVGQDGTQETAKGKGGGSTRRVRGGDQRQGTKGRPGPAKGSAKGPKRNRATGNLDGWTRLSSQPSQKVPEEEEEMEEDDEQSAELGGGFIGVAKDEEVDMDDIACQVCKRREDAESMLLCGDGEGKGCDRGWHIHCLDPPLKKIPADDWFCSACSRGRRPKVGGAKSFR